MLELKNNIFYVGVKDPTLRIFDIFMETEYGTTYNAVSYTHLTLPTT